MPASRNAIQLTATSIAGISTFDAHLSYRLDNRWDLLLGYDVVAGLSLLSFGGRYHIPSTTPTLTPYLAVEFLSAGTGTGFLAGAGYSLELDVPGWTGFGTVGFVSGPGGSTAGYDVGIQSSASPQFSFVVGVSNLFTPSGVYIGVSIDLQP
jgi:hypothetical protein